MSERMPHESRATAKAGVGAPGSRGSASRAATPTTAPDAGAAERQLTAMIEPEPASVLYMLTLGMVAVAMVLLPIVYVALVAAVGYLVYLHAISGGEWFGGLDGSTSGLRMRGFLLLYVGPLVVGAIVLFFLVKPLFAPRGRRMRPYSIDSHEAPGLHRLVQGIATAIGAPVPSRIDIDCDANASASFRKGFLSFLGNDLVLTIGLPLVACMGTRQFAGVVAHELGHFTQGAGMRLTYIIQRVNGWFARVVYERDRWDEWLAESSGGGFAWMTLVVLTAQVAVWASRCILWMLMMIGQGISCFASRQMEYDADRYENQIAGTKAFAGTFVRLHGLGVAQGKVQEDLAASWVKGRDLVDNIPGAVAVRFHQIPPESIAKIKDWMRTEKTGLFDTHPSPRDRIRAVQKSPCEGIVRDDRPATGLFKSFDVLCKAATRVYYHDVIGRSVPDSALIPVDFLTDERGPSSVAAAKTVKESEGDIPLE